MAWASFVAASILRSMVPAAQQMEGEMEDFFLAYVLVTFRLYYVYLQGSTLE